MDQELLAFIRSQIYEGRSPDEVRKILQEKGWQEPQISEALNAVLQQGQFGPAQNLPPKKSFFSTKVFKFVVIPLIVLGIIVAANWESTTILGKFAYYYFSAKTAPQIVTSTPVTAPNLLNESSSISLAHKTSLADLGINLPSVPGNGAVDFLNYFTYDYPDRTATNTFGIYSYIEKKGTWGMKYGDTTDDPHWTDESKINLDSQDENFLLQAASKASFSIYPDLYPPPSTPWETWKILFNPASILKFARRVVVKADQLQQSDPQTAEKLLQSLLVLGRHMEESDNSEFIQWSIGERLEETATDGLINFYTQQKDTSKANLFSDYKTELAGLHQIVSSSTSEILNLNIPLTALPKDKIGDAAFVDAVYKTSGTTKSDYIATLQMINTDDPIIQEESLVSLGLIYARQGPEPEFSITKRLLQRYESSRNAAVQIIAKYILSMDPNAYYDQIQKLMAAYNS